MQKINVWFLIARHWRAVARNPYTNAFHLSSVLLAILAPLATGSAWAALRHVGIVGADVLDLGVVLTTVSILVGFLFGVVTWIFQLRRDYSPSPLLNWTDASIPKLLNETFAVAAYGVLVAGTTALLAVPQLPKAPTLGLVQEAILAGLVVHLALTMLMLLRRLAIAYDKLGGEKDRIEQRMREKPATHRQELRR